MDASIGVQILVKIFPRQMKSHLLGSVVTEAKVGRHSQHANLQREDYEDLIYRVAYANEP